MDALDLGDLLTDVFRICNQDKPTLVRFIKNLEPDLFEGVHRKIFNLYNVYFKHYGAAIPESILKAELSKFEKPERVDAIAKDIYGKGAIPVDEKNYIIDRVMTHAKKQSLKKAIEDVYSNIDDGEFTDDKYQEAVDKVKNSIKFSLDTNVGVDLYDIDERYSRIAASLGNKVSTGYSWIDGHFGGGFGRKELISISGPSGLGKCCLKNTKVKIKIDINDLLYDKIQHLLKKTKVEHEVEIGALIEALGAVEMGDDVDISESNIQVDTPFGYKKIESVHKTQLNPEWEIETESGKKITVADKHRMEATFGWHDRTNSKFWCFAHDFKIGSLVKTRDGWEKITKCEHNGKHSAMYDLQVAECHSYYTNDFHSHNTIWLVNFGAQFLMRGYNVMHYSMEMSEERLGLRYDAVISNIAVKELQKVTDADQVDLKKAYQKLKMTTQSHLKMKEFPTGAASVLDLEAHLDEMELYHSFRPDVIITDYGDIMRATKSTKSTYEEQGQIFRELRALAIKREAVGLTATQSNRESFGEKGSTKDAIGMQNLADSIEKARILDGLFAIQQSEKDRTDIDAKGYSKIGLWIIKNRNGANQVHSKFKIKYDTMRIIEDLNPSA
jgi:replicative DNA helicase